ncbi:MAG TPA: zinc-binding alcohol dehydrogenase [Nocardioidaceae bacterium]|nr:zinc-binding alcohol dehydrogenase [Nocardioidaceae bacterium]
MGDHLRATAYWTLASGQGGLREEQLHEPGPGEALVRARHSAISRGTESLVHTGAVPPEIAHRMRAPFQEGDLPGSVKYGYLSVGVVEQGSDDLVGRNVFCLFPHQDRYVVPVAALTALPDGVPPRRATLAGVVETAVNALWDAAPRLGDRVAVVGAGMVGGAVAALLRTFPLQRLQLVDVDPARESLASALGVPLVDPAAAAGGCDLVVHASASAAGLRRSLELLGDEGEVIELSWYGTEDVTVPLGSTFHARRLAVRASQVSEVAAARRARRTRADRLSLAVELLRDDAFDALITGSSPFAELPQTMRRLLSGELPALCHVIDY